MSFGFSVSDFIVISGLIRTLIDALDSNTGSKVQYSRLSDELKSLHSAFLAVQDVVQKLRRDEKSHASTINAITYEIECCRKLVLGFTADMEKYRESLCHGGSSSKVKDTWRKISYKIFKEEDVVMLKDSLGRRVGAINLLMLVAGMYDMLFCSPALAQPWEGPPNRKAQRTGQHLAGHFVWPVRYPILFLEPARGLFCSRVSS